MRYGIYPITKAFLQGNDYSDAKILFECEDLELGDVIDVNDKRYVVSFKTNFDFSGIREISKDDESEDGEEVAGLLFHAREGVRRHREAQESRDEEGQEPRDSCPPVQGKP